MNPEVSQPDSPRIDQETDKNASVEIEAKLFRQEHRLVTLLINFFHVRPTFALDDPRRLAIRDAFWFGIVKLFLARGTAVAGIGVTAWFGVWFAREANQILENQNEMVMTQNTLLEDQIAQIGEQRVADEENRRRDNVEAARRELNIVLREAVSIRRDTSPFSAMLATALDAADHGIALWNGPGGPSLASLLVTDSRAYLQFMSQNELLIRRAIDLLKQCEGRTNATDFLTIAYGLMQNGHLRECLEFAEAGLDIPNVNSNVQLQLHALRAQVHYGFNEAMTGRKILDEAFQLVTDEHYQTDAERVTIRAILHVFRAEQERTAGHVSDGRDAVERDLLRAEELINTLPKRMSGIYGHLNRFITYVRVTEGRKAKTPSEIADQWHRQSAERKTKDGVLTEAQRIFKERYPDEQVPYDAQPGTYLPSWSPAPPTPPSTPYGIPQQGAATGFDESPPIDDLPSQTFESRPRSPVSEGLPGFLPVDDQPVPVPTTVN